MQDDDKLNTVKAELAAKCPEPGTFWRHRSGHLYCVLRGVIIEATLTPAIVYVSYGDATSWCRPLSEFTDGRFEQVTDLGALCS